MSYGPDRQVEKGRTVAITVPTVALHEIMPQGLQLKVWMKEDIANRHLHGMAWTGNAGSCHVRGSPGPVAGDVVCLFPSMP